MVLGYPTLGQLAMGINLLQILDIKVTQTHPAMMPLFTKRKLLLLAKADTIAKAVLKVNIPKYKI